MKPIKLTNVNFDSVIRSDKPVLVDFWAPWCPPCLALAPVLDELAKEEGESAVIGKVNVDEAKELAIRFGIRSLPSILIFLDGEPVSRMSGLKSKQHIQEALRAAAQLVASARAN